MKQLFSRIAFLGIVMVLAAGCGSRFGSAEPTPTIAPLPTFTPTPESADSVAEQPPEPTPTDAPEPPAADEIATESPEDEADVQDDTGVQPPQDSAILIPTPTIDSAAQAPAPTATTAAAPILAVSAEIINVRSGPGTSYPQIGTANGGEEFALTGRNEVGDWWQVCCFAEQPGWIYGPLAEVENAESVAVATDIPESAAVEAEPASEPAVAEVPAESVVEEPVVEEPVAEAPPSEAPAADTEALAPGVPLSHSGTTGNLNPNAQYQIVNYRVIGYGENNAGILDKGSQHLIFVTVIDANGNGIDGAVVKDAVDDKLHVITGAKGPGKNEIEMNWDHYKLYVASDPSGPVTSQVSNQMNTRIPHKPDVVGKLGPVENEYAVCPTLDDRCPPELFSVHFSYAITFQKVK